MIRISKLADYATVIMSHLACDPSRVLSARDIAQGVLIAQPTVSKLLKLMAKAGLLKAVRGAGGGYALARSAEAICLKDIILAVEGIPQLTACCLAGHTCSQATICGIQTNWQIINATIVSILHNVTLADMASPLTREQILKQSEQ